MMEASGGMGTMMWGMGALGLLAAIILVLLGAALVNSPPDTPASGSKTRPVRLGSYAPERMTSRPLHLAFEPPWWSPAAPVRTHRTKVCHRPA